MTRLRVLHVIQNLNYGGMERLVADLVRRTDPAAFECAVLVLQYAGRFSEDLAPQGLVHQAPAQPPWSLLWPGVLIRELRRLAPDVVHIHSGVWYKTSRAARHAGVPRVIFTAHGRPTRDDWYGRLFERRAAARTDVVVAVSDALAEYYARAIAPAEKIRVVVNGVDVDHFRPVADDGALRTELGLAPDVPILGSIGRLEPIKGYDVMLDAFGALRASWSAGGGPAPVLVIGGDGSTRSALVAQRGEGVHLLGWRDDVEKLHAAFSLFTLSSFSEGTSVSLLEAMSAGLCPVVTDVGGNAAVLGPTLRHRLVAPHDPAALAAAWRAALGDRATLASDARGARQQVIETFSLAAMVRRYEALYRGA